MALRVPRQTSQLLGLSTEIQLVIIHHLLPSIKSIHAVAKTCRHLYEISLHLSVHTFRNLGIRKSSKETKEWAGARTMNFIRYITITRPQLARHVKCVAFGRLEPEAWDGLDKTRAPKGEELDLYRGLIETTFTKDDCIHWKFWQSEWLDGLATCVEDAEAALLLVACPNLESILTCDPENPRRFSRVIEVAANRSFTNSNPGIPALTQGPLQHLKEVYLESEDNKYGHCQWSDYAKVFQIPSLRSLEIIRANGENFHADKLEAAVPKKSSNVDEIILRKSCITAGVLHALTAIPKALRSFEYTRGVCHMYDVEMMPRDLVDAMLPHADTLDHLHFNCHDDWPTARNPEMLCLGLGLKKLTTLKSLTAGMQALIGTRNPYAPQNERMNYGGMPVTVENAPKMIDCIPDDLEDLQINYCGKEVITQVQELLDACAVGQFSRLRLIRLLFNKELISPNEINLQFDPSIIQVDICLQSEENRCYDLIQRVAGKCSSVCTRIFAEDVRDKWLRYRCRDVAGALVNEGVIFEPET